MSRYVARIIGPSGMETYLSRGREVRLENATRHSHPSAAWKAAQSYRKRHARETFTYDVIDTRDPERRVA